MRPANSSIANGIRTWIQVSAIHLNDAALRSAEYSERHFKFLGFLSVLLPSAYVVDLYVGRPSFDTLGIRIMAFLLSLPLLFHDAKPLREFCYFHLYFVALVAYILPFSFGLMLALNAATAPEGQQIEMFWMLQYVIALFIFIQLIYNGTLATVLWILSTIAVLSSLALLNEINWAELKRVTVYPVTGYLTALFFGIITNRSVDYVNLEKLRAASAIGGNIAHELRTPLASIRSLARAVNRHSQVLVDTYSRARDVSLHAGELTQDQVNGLRSALELIEREVAYSNIIIDMLLLNTTGKSPEVTPSEPLVMSDVVSEAIDRFPFNNSHERKLINVSIIQDFPVNASRLLLVHVFFNLLKNGIHYAQKSSGGTLEVRVQVRHGRKMVELTDTGPGINPAARKYIFDRFYTTSATSQGAGIGLSFCKSVMDSIGGDIQCDSIEGESTTFRLVFP